MDGLKVWVWSKKEHGTVRLHEPQAASRALLIQKYKLVAGIWRRDGTPTTEQTIAHGFKELAFTFGPVLIQTAGPQHPRNAGLIVELLNCVEVSSTGRPYDPFDGFPDPPDDFNQRLRRALDPTNPEGAGP